MDSSAPLTPHDADDGELLTVEDAPSLPNGMATILCIRDRFGKQTCLATVGECGYLRRLGPDRKFLTDEYKVGEPVSEQGELP